MAEYYGKKTNWLKLILIYLVIGGIVYYLVYYFFLKPNGAYKTANPMYTPGTNTAPSTSKPKPYSY